MNQVLLHKRRLKLLADGMDLRKDRYWRGIYSHYKQLVTVTNYSIEYRFILIQQVLSILWMLFRSLYCFAILRTVDKAMVCIQCHFRRYIRCLFNFLACPLKLFRVRLFGLSGTSLENVGSK